MVLTRSGTPRASSRRASPKAPDTLELLEYQEGLFDELGNGSPPSEAFVAGRPS